MYIKDKNDLLVSCDSRHVACSNRLVCEKDWEIPVSGRSYMGSKTELDLRVMPEISR